MIQSERIKKMLHILKTNANDLNVNISIVDYDIEQQCDYEQLTLHLKETYQSLEDIDDFLRITTKLLKESGDTLSEEEVDLTSYISEFISVFEGKTTEESTYVIYKDFIIRSQVYYDVSTDRYMSALDGDIILKKGKLPKINILTNLNTLIFSDDYITIEAQLIDAETEDPIKNQALSLFFSSVPETAVAYTTTNKNGIGVFHFSLSEANDAGIVLGGNVLHVEYKGNKKYQAVKSAPVFVDVNGLASNIQSSVKSSISAKLDVSSNINIKYDISLNGQSLTKAFRQYSKLDVLDSELLKGDVLFYINDVFVGQVNQLIDVGSKSHAEITVPFPSSLYNQNINIQVIFKGNQYFLMNTQNMISKIDKVVAEDITLTLTQPNPYEAVYLIQLEFFVPEVSLESDIYTDTGHTTAFYETANVDLYLTNKNQQLGTLDDNAPFARLSNFNVESIERNGESYCKISTNANNSVEILNWEDYGLTFEDGGITVTAKYHGNAIIGDFVIDETLGYYIKCTILQDGLSDFPVNGATVKLYKIVQDADNVLIQTKTTDSNGYCIFTDVLADNYYFEVSKTQYITTSYTCLSLNSNKTIPISISRDMRNNGD